MIEKKVPLFYYTTIKIGGVADYMAFPHTYEEVYHLLMWAKEKDLPVFFLGRGANTIFGDIKGVVINTKNLNRMKVKEEEDKVIVVAQCGVPLSQVVKLGVELNLEGIYRLAGFPASVGGAVAMNAGAFGFEVSKALKEVLFLDWEGNVERVSRKDLEFSYRKSPFPERGMVLEAVFEFKKAKGSVKEEYERIKNKRKATQPINMPTCGSTFKNPEGNYAGYLLERVGMKGYKVGGVAFSNLHANFLINLGKGNIDEVYKILEEAKRRVYEEFGIKLEEEVKIIEGCSPYRRKV